VPRRGAAPARVKAPAISAGGRWRARWPSLRDHRFALFNWALVGRAASADLRDSLVAQAREPRDLARGQARRKRASHSIVSFLPHPLRTKFGPRKGTGRLTDAILWGHPPPIRLRLALPGGRKAAWTGASLACSTVRPAASAISSVECPAVRALLIHPIRLARWPSSWKSASLAAATRTAMRSDSLTVAA
jgi:hypothetical protein